MRIRPASQLEVPDDSVAAGEAERYAVVLLIQRTEGEMNLQTKKSSSDNNLGISGSYVAPLLVLPPHMLIYFRLLVVEVRLWGCYHG